MQKTVFIGAGNMAEALAAGMLAKGMTSPQAIRMTDVSPERLAHAAEKYGVETMADNALAVADAGMIVLAVKPQVFPEVRAEVVDALPAEATVVSIMAGVPTASIAGDLPLRVVRAMPNTPALAGAGAAGVAPGEYATEIDVKRTLEMMRAVGRAVVVREEQMDAVTALSGSGPAYVFLLLEGMLEAAERMGLDGGTARELALATVGGAARLMEESGEEAEALRRRVTSKGGTTEAALNRMEARGVKEAIVEALLAAQARSRELANG